VLAPQVSVIVVCTNEKQHLQDCLGSLSRQSYPRVEIILVDNGSTDASAEYVAASFPEVRIISTGSNLGYAPANNAGFQAARGELLAVLNPDTEVHPDFVRELVEAFDDPGVGLATSRICYFDDRERINTCGNDVHLSGLGYCRGLDEPASRYESPAAVASVSGCAFMVRRALLDKIGSFDAAFFIYLEDTDLSIRAWLAGQEVRYVPGSIVYHKYRLRLTSWKFYLLERNRRVMLLKNFRWATLAALLPCLFLTGLMMWTYAVIRGPRFLGAKLRAHAWIYRHWGEVMAKRGAVQRLRKVSDGQVLKLWRSQLPANQVFGEGAPARLLGPPVNAAFAVLGWPARRFVH
jgi:GT2 family glycosyltransferase